MSPTSVRGGAIWWSLTKERQAWCINFAGKTVWCMPERFEIYLVYKYSSFPFLYYVGRCRLLWSTSRPLRVAWSVGLSPSELCRIFGSDRDTVCVQDSGGPRETAVAYNGPILAKTVLCSFNTIQPSSSCITGTLTDNYKFNRLAGTSTQVPDCWLNSLLKMLSCALFGGGANYSFGG